MKNNVKKSVDYHNLLSSYHDDILAVYRGKRVQGIRLTDSELEDKSVHECKKRYHEIIAREQSVANKIATKDGKVKLFKKLWNEYFDSNAPKLKRKIKNKK